MNDRPSPTRYAITASPFGPLLVVETSEGLSRIDFLDGATPFEAPDGWVEVDHLPSGALEQLDAYFRGERRRFELPLAPRGKPTPFQRRVWRALEEIPYGTTASYREVATAIGNPDAVRAVGAANGRNPLAIVVPCHRVVGSDGSLTGFAGGIERKAALLAHEARHANPLGL
jgi:methylated-DNA-[protein]-cysteine S-methyltransferase